MGAWADATGTAPTVIAADVQTGLDELSDLGLLGRTTSWVAPKAPVGCTVGATDGAVSGAVHPVLDWAVSFRSHSPDLVAAIDAFLGTGVGSAPGDPLVFDVEERGDGEVRLATDHEWLFSDRQSCLDQLTSVINEYAVWSHGCVAFHAGAVRSPTGEILLFPAVSGAGKSTLAGALVAAGWEYLGDEAIGVRPESCVAVGYPKRVALGPNGRAFLGLPESGAWDHAPTELRSEVVRLAGDVGPVTRMLLPTYVAGAELVIEDLTPVETVDALLAHTLDLAPVGHSVAIVGSSGAGKTTLVDIMLGLLEPTGGTITIDERDMADVKADWQASIGLVPQDMYLFDDSLPSNIALGEPDAAIDGERLVESIGTFEEVRAANSTFADLVELGSLDALDDVEEVGS